MTDSSPVRRRRVAWASHAPRSGQVATSPASASAAHSERKRCSSSRVAQPPLPTSSRKAPPAVALHEAGDRHRHRGEGDGEEHDLNVGGDKGALRGEVKGADLLVGVEGDDSEHQGDDRRARQDPAGDGPEHRARTGAGTYACLGPPGKSSM